MSEPSARPGRGRRRSGVPARPDLSTTEQILDAAAFLFVHQGYAATSTRAVAERVGIRQASLYYHFADKEAILEELLRRTVQPSVEVAAALAESPASAAARLHALVSFDVGQLNRAPTNVATLYHLPEVAHERHVSFREERRRLRDQYAALVRAALAEAGDGEGLDADDLVDVVFGMVESIVTIRADDARDEPAEDRLVPALADSCLRVLGHDSRSIRRATDEAAGLLDS